MPLRYEVLAAVCTRPLRIHPLFNDPALLYALRALGHTVSYDKNVNVFLGEKTDSHRLAELDAPAMIIFDGADLMHDITHVTRFFNLTYISNSRSAASIGLRDGKALTLSRRVDKPARQFVWHEVVAWKRTLQEAHHAHFVHALVAHTKQAWLRHTDGPMPDLRTLIKPALLDAFCEKLSEYKNIKETHIVWDCGQSTVEDDTNTFRICQSAHRVVDLTSNQVAELLYAGYDVSEEFYAALVPALYYATCWMEKYPAAYCIQAVSVPLLRTKTAFPWFQHLSDDVPHLSLIVSDDEELVERWLKLMKSLRRFCPRLNITTLVVGRIHPIYTRLPNFKWSRTPVYVVGNDPHIARVLEVAVQSQAYNTGDLRDIYTYLTCVDPVKDMPARKTLKFSARFQT